MKKCYQLKFNRIKINLPLITDELPLLCITVGDGVTIFAELLLLVKSVGNFFELLLLVFDGAGKTAALALTAAHWLN